MEQLLAILLQATNEIVATALVVMAASLLLYNLSRNLRNRIARTSGAVLACVTFAYVCDVFLSLGPDSATTAAVLRVQWLAIAFIPATMFHLSDALLATTGLPSRGRRKRISRIFYMISGVFFVAATQTDLLINVVTNAQGAFFRAGPMFWLFVIYYMGTNIVTFINVDRARRRCLTRSTERRMTYLQIAILTPAFGIFPFSTLLMPGQVDSFSLLLLINLANIFVLAMLVFLSYPLSFFGSDQPDRVVKVELLRFLLRGPATALLALAVIIGTTRAIEIFSLPGETFMPFAVVSIILLWQWSIAVAMPRIERWLIYNNDDDEQLVRLQELSDRILTREDLLQLVGATLEAICDYLRVEVAFVATKNNPQFEILQQVGEVSLDDAALADAQDDLLRLLQRAVKSEHGAKADKDTQQHRYPFQMWRVYQVVPLYSPRLNGNGGIIGVLGIQAAPQQLQLDPEDEQLLYRFVHRTEKTLDDLRLHTEVFAALEGLLPQISSTHYRSDGVEYRIGRQPAAVVDPLPPRDEIYGQIHAALRHYWGGPGMTRSRLQDLTLVQQDEEADSTINALRNLLQAAIERLRPEGERTMTSPEWTLYNIIDLRYIEGKKVRDVARRLSMSEADLYRKQRAAIEAMTDTILQMESEARNSS